MFVNKFNPSWWGEVDVSMFAAVYQAQYEPLNVRHKVPLFAKINYC